MANAWGNIDISTLMNNGLAAAQTPAQPAATTPTATGGGSATVPNGSGTMTAAVPTNFYAMDRNPTSYEQRAGVQASPFYSMLNQDGTLGSSYAVDPSKSDAFNQMKGIAESADASPWAAMQLQSNQLNAQTQKDQSAASVMGANDQAMQQLMTQGGGTNSGAAALLAAQGSRNQTMANQNINDQANKNALGIQATDAQNKQTLLGQVANTQTSAQAANATTAAQDTANANLYSTNRYNQQLSAFGAEQTAAGQRAAANSGGKK